MQRLKIIAIASLLIWSSYTQAANWVLLSQATDGTRFYIDTERSELNREQPMTWEKYITSKVEKRSYGWEKSRIYQSEYSCENKQYRTLNIFVYDAKGALLESDTEISKWYIAVPSSSGEGILDQVCAARDQMRAQ